MYIYAVFLYAEQFLYQGFIKWVEVQLGFVDGLIDFDFGVDLVQERLKLSRIIMENLERIEFILFQLKYLVNIIKIFDWQIIEFFCVMYRVVYNLLVVCQFFFGDRFQVLLIYVGRS